MNKADRELRRLVVSRARRASYHLVKRFGMRPSPKLTEVAKECCARAGWTDVPGKRTAPDVICRYWESLHGIGSSVPLTSYQKRKRAKTSKAKLPPIPRIPEFYSSWEWAKLRFEVLKAYGPVCMLCRSTERIVVDHIKPRRKFPELELDFDNMQVLCDRCNRGKSNDDYTDFRPKLAAPELTEPEMAHLKDIMGVH